ncbi:ShlB/FhaC/HecB family hemolysin secretion/activation protein [Pseudomonas huanghezhanensis]|uniref:ShlB/FhaC/HecB family hemolysin secretion/activation protein n=1 Tax=Pseudomonas huanghezhanensis TaxID=3002903 RepID=UPI00228618A2|nr:ShlB/FhaC/HecB family hemolysin secretion/activation protein [Pseudomonas sp. BSw22131]
MYFSLSRGALCVLLAAASLPAFAAPTPGEQDLIRDRQDRLLEDQRRRLEELKELPGKQSTPSVEPAPVDIRCFTINTITLKGADALSASDRDTLLKPYLRQCMGVPQLNGLLKVITDCYLEKGLVTSRAYLPQQDLSKGHLDVLVIEGKLENIKGDAGSGLSPRELAMAFPGGEGQLLNLREIEQMVDQLNRLPSNQAQMELTPGQAVGGSDVLVKNTPQKLWRASLSRNNDGQRSTGEQQWNTGLEWDSPLGLSDQVMLRSGHDAMTDHQHASRNALFNYSLPLGWWTFSYTYNQSDYRSVAQANGFDFKQTGDSANHQMRAERVIYRDALSKTSLSVGFAHLRTNNYIEDSRLALSSNRISEVQYGFNHGRRVGSAFVNLDLGMQQGVSALGAQDNGQPGPGEADVRYRKYTGTLSYLQPFKVWGESLTFTSLATDQRSEDVLFSAQRTSLGGSSSVRGMKDQFLSGDSGGYWRNDLRLTRPLTLEWLRPAFAEYGTSFGYDQGVIRNDRYNGAEHGRVSSNAIELFARGQHVTASVTYAHLLERPAGLIERESPIYFRLDFFL